MLILTRKTGETITIGAEITVRVIEINGKQVRLGVEAPREKYAVHREEVLLRLQAEVAHLGRCTTPSGFHRIGQEWTCLECGRSKVARAVLNDGDAA